MICLLILVQINDVLWLNIACPLQVKHVALTFKHGESRALASIYESVVNMTVISNSKSHKQCLDLVTLVAPDSVA